MIPCLLRMARYFVSFFSTTRSGHMSGIGKNSVRYPLFSAESRLALVDQSPIPKS